MNKLWNSFFSSHVSLSCWSWLTLQRSLWSFDFIKWSQIIATIDFTHFDSFEHRLIFINSTNSMKWAGVIYFGREKKIFAKQLNFENYATWWCLVYERTRLYFIYIYFFHAFTGRVFCFYCWAKVSFHVLYRCH